MAETGVSELKIRPSAPGDSLEKSHLSEGLKPSRREIEPYAIPNPDLYNVAYAGGADLPHHGVLHGEETAILSAVLVNVAYQDVLKRRGKEAADAFRAGIDEKTLLLAAAHHDCGRKTDWGLHKGEMQKHGPRGADIISERWKEVDPTLSEEQVELFSNLIRLHTPTTQEGKDRIKDKLHLSSSQSRAARRADKERNFEDYDSEELMLRLLQEADKLGLPRGYYSRKPESSRRVPFAMGTSAVRELKSHTPILRKRPGHFEQNLRFSQSKELQLYALADDLTRMSRRDPEINQKFENTPHRQGAAVEAADKLGILKP